MAEGIESELRHWRASHEAVAPLGKVFLMGCPKSGTTWLQNLLDAHPQMVIRGEGCFAWQLVPILAQAFRAFNEHQKKMDAIVQLRDLDLLLTARAITDGQLARYVAHADKPIGQLKVVGDKTPQNTVGMPLLNQLYPDAKFINIIRDPRDTATSAWFHFGKTDPRKFEEYIEYFITRVWPLNVQTSHEAGLRLGGRYMEFRYEDLRMREQEHVRSILQFLDVDASDDCVACCIEAASFSRKSGGRKPGETDSRSFYRSGTSGDWRNHLPADLVQRCCEKIEPLMRAWGYEPSCAPVV